MWISMHLQTYIVSPRILHRPLGSVWDNNFVGFPPSRSGPLCHFDSRCLMWFIPWIHFPTFLRNGGVKMYQQTDPIRRPICEKCVGWNLRFPWRGRDKIRQAESYELVAEEAVKQLGLDLTGVGNPSWGKVWILDGFWQVVGWLGAEKRHEWQGNGWSVWLFDITSQNRWIDWIDKYPQEMNIIYRF